MKKQYLIILLMLFPLTVNAARGCCSNHQGTCGCTSYGKQICCDGTESPSCTCQPPVIYGCTDYKANNYNANANRNDGSCTYTIKGCTDSNAKNYNQNANTDDGSCLYLKVGCTDPKANNYVKDAEKDDGSCTYTILGCMDPKAKNYNEKANKEDNSCIYEKTEEEKEKELQLGEIEELEKIDKVEEENNYSNESVIDEPKDNSNNDIIGFLALGTLVGGGYTSYQYKKKKEAEKPKGIKKILSKFKKTKRKKYPWIK